MAIHLTPGRELVRIIIITTWGGMHNTQRPLHSLMNWYSDESRVSDDPTTSILPPSYAQINYYDSNMNSWPVNTDSINHRHSWHLHRTAQKHIRVTMAVLCSSPAKSPHSPPNAMSDQRQRLNHHPHAHSILLQMHRSCGPCCLCHIVSSLCTVPQAVYDKEEEEYDGNALWTDTEPANQMHRMQFIVGHRKFRLAFPGCQHGRQCTSVVTLVPGLTSFNGRWLQSITIID